jgi:hypothetical protein
MTYAILQQSIDSPPTVEQLRLAFAAIPGLTRYDGALQARDAYGILAAGLASQSASALQRALHEQGVETFVADEAGLAVLPPPKVLTRADPLPAGLVLYDALGRQQSVPWSDVVFLAAGNVFLTQFRRETTQRVSVAPVGMSGSVAVVPFVVSESSTREEKKLNLLADIFLAGGGRYRILPRQFSYAYLGASVSQRASDNFLTLAGDLLRFASGAFRNRGAALLAGSPPRTLSYPSRRAFEQEITWCLWMRAQA